MKMYTGRQLDLIAFPMGGIGAGTLCLKGVGALGNVALRNHPNYRNDPMMFSAVWTGGEDGVALVLEAPVPKVDVFAYHRESGSGLTGRNYGLPRYDGGTFSAKFPFATLDLQDEAAPLQVSLTGWSPFVPGEEDLSSLPYAALEYTFINRTDKKLDAVYYFAAENFMKQDESARVRTVQNGFVFDQPKTAGNPAAQGAFCAQLDRDCRVDAAWMRPKGGWSFDVLTMVWNGIRDGKCEDKQHEGGPASPGATLAAPFSLEPGASTTIRLRMSWYVPHSGLRAGVPEREQWDPNPETYSPWYAGQFKGIDDAAADWRERYGELRNKTQAFTDCFFDSTLPGEILDAVSANLSILKSPTVLRQQDGKLWCWEGSHDDRGSCHGSCTHVWNYQQAVCNLFPALERSLRDTEFTMSQVESGHQTFRSRLPIAKIKEPDFHAASDGQLGGIIKLYREWRIAGDEQWLRSLWPLAKKSLQYCIETWDPNRLGVLMEPHHNTYDIEFWGADGMCTGFYLGALKAAAAIAEALGDDPAPYLEMYQRGRAYMEEKLYNGEYFYQVTEWKGLQADMHLENYTPEVQALLEVEGPKYQYGTGCISDQVLGIWMAEVAGIEDVVDDEKLRTSLRSIFGNNFKADLSKHANPQRPGFALGDDGGLLLCTWPYDGRPSLPFVYSDEVWTGIEYQVAAHMLMKGMVDEALTIVRTLRDRYDGIQRNPYDEYECGHWYARAMASYALLQGYTGVRYDAVTKTLFVKKHNADAYRTFLATATGFGTVTVEGDAATFTAAAGSVEIANTVWQ